MLTRTQKESKWKDFMDSYFGMHNWTTIFLLKINISYQVRTIRFLLRYAKSTDKDAILENLSDIERLRMKQHLFLDAIMKAQICIESLLIAVDILSRDYGKIAETMTFYPQDAPRRVIGKVHNREIDVRKAFVIPPATSIEVLTQEEMVLIEQLSAETVSAIYKGLNILADYYERYYIVYMKCKHGLTIETGSGFSPAKDIKDSLVYVHDRRRNIDALPSDRMFTKVVGYGPPEWFNTVSILTINENLDQDFASVTELILILTNYLIDNHLAYISNCGENFLPYDIKSPTTVSLRYLGDRDLSETEREDMKRIQDKLLPIMHTPNLALNINRNIHDSNMEQALKKGPVTTWWTGD